MPKKGGTKAGNFIRKARTKIKQWRQDNPKSAAAASRFGKSMSESSQEMASSGGDGTVYKGHTVAVNENDLRLNDTTEQLLSTKVGDDLAYAPYEEWSSSKRKKDIIT